MISIAISSQKGGVGKTTLSIDLAHAFARAGMNTLLVDADPQGSVGLSLTRQSRLLSGFYDFLADPGIPSGETDRADPARNIFPGSRRAGQRL